MIIEKTATATVIGLATVVSAIDPSLTTIVTTVMGAIGLLVPLWFNYKTNLLKMQLEAVKTKAAELDAKAAELKGEIDVVKKTSNGMKDALVVAVGDASLAKGVLAGIEQAEAKAAVKDAAKAEERAEAKAIIQPPEPLLPSQVQPIAAKEVEGVELNLEQIDKMIRELQSKRDSVRDDALLHPPTKPPTA